MNISKVKSMKPYTPDAEKLGDYIADNWSWDQRSLCHLVANCALQINHLNPNDGTIEELFDVLD